MNIDIMDLQDCVKIDKRSVIKCAKTVLNVMGEKRAELSLLFVNDSYIKRLNWQYRRLRSKTDVLAFSMRSEKALGDVSKNILGDVVVSTETAKKEAKKRNIPIQREMNLYLIHGILHLLGYDDKKAIDTKKMKAKEKEILRIVGES